MKIRIILGALVLLMSGQANASLLTYGLNDVIGSLYSYDLATNTSTRIGDTPFNGYSGLAMEATSVPEPPALLLFGIGLLGLIGVMWRRKPL